jgi:hypothetical protein
MAMRPCAKCFENQWIYLFEDATGIITATCKYCGAQVSFESRRARKRRDPNYRQKQPDVPTDAYRHQDADDDGQVPW